MGFEAGVGFFLLSNKKDGGKKFSKQVKVSLLFSTDCSNFGRFFMMKVVKNNYKCPATSNYFI